MCSGPIITLESLGSAGTQSKLSRRNWLRLFRQPAVWWDKNLHDDWELKCVCVCCSCCGLLSVRFRAQGQRRVCMCVRERDRLRSLVMWKLNKSCNDINRPLCLFTYHSEAIKILFAKFTLAMLTLSFIRYRWYLPILY